MQPGVGLFAFICLVLLSILTLIHLNVEQLWERFYPQRPATRPDENLRVCLLPLYRVARHARTLPAVPHSVETAAQ